MSIDDLSDLLRCRSQPPPSAGLLCTCPTATTRGAVTRPQLRQQTQRRAVRAAEHLPAQVHPKKRHLANPDRIPHGAVSVPPPRPESHVKAFQPIGAPNARRACTPPEDTIPYSMQFQTTTPFRNFRFSAFILDIFRISKFLGILRDISGLSQS